MNTNFLSQSKVGNILIEQEAQARQLINERWDNLGFTKGLNGYMKENMSLLFENQAKEMLKEANNAANSGQFQTVIFPLVRRVFSRLLANDIVSIQAMNLPIGKLFFILPKTSERRWEMDESGNTTGSHYGLMGYERIDRRNGEVNKRYYQPDELVSLTPLAESEKPEVVKYHKKSLYDMFYNDGLFDQSKGKIHIKQGEIEPMYLDFDGEFHNVNETRTINGIECKHVATHQDGTLRNIIVSVAGFSSYNAGRLTGPDGNEMDTETFLSSMRIVCKKAITSVSGTTEFKEMEPVHARCVTQRYGHGLVEYGQICDAQGKMYIELDLTKPVNNFELKTVDGYIGIDPEQVEMENLADFFEVVWCQYDSLELETEMGEVSFELSEVTVSEEPRKLRATWSPELAQDVAAFHAIDAEAEMTAVLSEQIGAEIDREILKDLRLGSPWQLRWDYSGWRRLAGFSTNYTQKDWNQTLMTTINQISAQIHKATLRGGANFIVVSTEISAVLNDLEYFHVTDANAEAVQYSMGIEKIGSLQGRYTVYVDPMAPHYSLIMGHKGDSLLDTGYIYAPYIPLQLTPVIYNAANFAPVKGIMTRYAKKMVNNRYYGAIVCDNLPHFNIAELR